MCGLLLIAAGCASVSQPADNDLHGVVKMFHHDLRWKYFKAAAARVDPHCAHAFLDELEDSEKDLNITDWEIRDVTLSDDGNRANIRVRLKYYKIPSTVLKDETVEQVWKKINDSWTLVEQTGGPIEISPPGKKAAKPASDKQPGQPDSNQAAGEKH